MPGRSPFLGKVILRGRKCTGFGVKISMMDGSHDLGQPGEGRPFKERATKLLLLILGFMSLALGALGVVVPILPTTPLLLLAAACFLRSSRRLYLWLLNNKFLGSYVRDYLVHRAVRKSVKVITLVLLWCTLAFSAWLVNGAHLRLVLAIVGVAVSLHVLRLKTLRGNHDTRLLEDCGEEDHPG